jgi:hypothetical protein
MAFRMFSRGRSVGLSVAQHRIRGGTAPRMSTAAPLAASTTLTNPLLDQSRTPRFRIIAPSDVGPAVASVLAAMEADVAQLEKTLEIKVLGL